MAETVKSKVDKLVSTQLSPDGKLLDLDDKEIGSEELKLMAEREELSQVEQLYLSHNSLAGEAVEILAGSEIFSNLRSLFLNHNNLGDAEAELIAQSPNIKNIYCLMFEANNIGPKGAEFLAKSANLEKLENPVHGLQSYWFARGGSLWQIDPVQKSSGLASGQRRSW